MKIKSELNKKVYNTLHLQLLKHFTNELKNIKTQ